MDAVVTGKLNGQAAIVTGAARGIGLAIAKRLAQDGCRIIAWDLDHSASAEFTPSLAQAVDVTDLGSVQHGERDFGPRQRKVERADGLSDRERVVQVVEVDVWRRDHRLNPLLDAHGRHLEAYLQVCRTVVDGRNDVGVKVDHETAEE